MNEWMNEWMKKVAVTQVDKNEFFSDEKELIILLTNTLSAMFLLVYNSALTWVSISLLHKHILLLITSQLPFQARVLNWPFSNIMSSFSSEKNSFLSTRVTATFFIHSFIHSFIHWLIHCFYRGNIFPKKVRLHKLID